MKIVYSDQALGYRLASHPEGPERIQAACHFLQKKNHRLIEPRPASTDELESVHTPDLIRRVQEGDYYDPDCPRYPDIFHYASLSAGAAITAQEVHGFSLMRPPGHHAGRNFLGGFCYFNNIAVAIRCSGLKTLIVDIDGHHGNGTEDIFLQDPQVTYISLHQGQGYPGTGQRSRHNIMNRPLGSGCGDDAYLQTLRSSIDEAGGDFLQLAVSAGFDAHRRDALTTLSLTREAYLRIGRILKKLGLPCFLVMEGGYVPSDVGPNIHALLSGLEKEDEVQ